MKYFTFFLLIIFISCQVGENKIESDIGEPINDNQMTAYSSLMDLNGDSIPDTIDYKILENKYQFTLQVNNALYEGYGEGLYSDYQIVDINQIDSYKEIAVKETGPSDDYAVQYFFYDGEEIKRMGHISNMNLVLDGSGIIKTKTRGSILHTWWFDDTFELNDDHILENVSPELVEMDSKLTMKKKLILYQSRDSNEISAELLPGENVMITLTDNKKWCLVEADNGKKGWFAIEKSGIQGTNIHASEFFDGLCMVD
jgi:hypothetical protein